MASVFLLHEGVAELYEKLAGLLFYFLCIFVFNLLFGAL